MSQLVLGWHVGDGLDPTYWTAPTARLGKHKASDLFVTNPTGLAAHTAIIAQSGSGKSFFLGRLVEEIALRTRARCLILDPNADFRRLSEIAESSLWSTAKYDLAKQRGRLPHEGSREEFASQWQKVQVRVRGGGSSRERTVLPITVPWLSVSPEFLAENLDPVDRTGVQNCHEFVRAIHDLLALRTLLGQRTQSEFMGVAERLLRQAVTSPEDFLATVRDEWGLASLPKHVDVAAGEALQALLGLPDSSLPLVQNAIERRLALALSASRSVGETARQFYFGRLGSCRGTGVVEDELAMPTAPGALSARIDVIDLPSIDTSTRLLVVNAVLQAEWELARASWEVALQHAPDVDTRVPLFIVIDEAHNLIPREPRTQAEAAIREQFRTFVAEGRKYGVFVIVVTQRPDKVDPIVLSECENRAVMRLSSEATVELTKRSLGLEDVPQAKLSSCLKFPLGRALLVGPWSAGGPCTMYAAARRTVEGGRNLRHEYWASGVDSQMV